MMAGVEGVKGLGIVLESLYIYHPTKNTFQKPDLPLHIIKLFLMVWKRQLWLTPDKDKVQINEEIVHGRV